MLPEITTNDWVELHDHTATSPVIIHAPHGGNVIPTWARDSFLITDDELRAEQLALEDHHTDQIARHASSTAQSSAVISKLSRFIIDVERFDSPEEEMLAVGMGMLYTHGTQRQRIREVAPDLEAGLRRYYKQYGELVTDLTARALETHGHVIIIDLHSYPSKSLPYELHAEEFRSPLSIGYDDAHMTSDLRRTIRDQFDWLEQHDNLTFKGSYVPLEFYQRDSRVRSVMLEIRRDQYLDERDHTILGSEIERLTSSLASLATSLSSGRL